MVKICPQKYPTEKEELYKEHFKVFDFPLSDFQKNSIEATVTGNHVLVCAPTGNGKSLPAEFAIQYFTNLGKKVIYTSPIKALSNQKFYDFTQKFPHIKVGLLTGDIKLNPEANVLIMTAEILQNTLYKKAKTGADFNPALLTFDMDFDNELSCVIHDEVHSINLEERGHVWENIFMLLPHHVQNVMLSATLDSPEKFAQWIEERNPDSMTRKEVYLTTVKERVVPLIHSAFITTTNAIFKIIKDKALEAEIRSMINKPILLQDSKSPFNEPNYHKIKKMVDLFENKKVFMKRSFVLNQVCKYMVDNNLLPCACFILSRKQIEIAAREVTTILLEDDSKVPYVVRRECEQILRSKIPNYQEYLELPEYISMVALLEKGIGTHHAGTMPILKEIVELLFSKGYIKLLFCSETFSMGLNMPIKTVIFTDLYKFDGSQFRILQGHEYNQAGGRAGRRGLDTVGHVIHLTNLFKKVELTEYKNMMRGEPQKLISKFMISYNLLLNLIDSGVKDFVEFAKKSMIQNEIEYDLQGQKRQIEEKEKHIRQVGDSIHHLRTPLEKMQQFIEIKKAIPLSVNKKRKDLEREIESLKDDNKFIESDVKTLEKYDEYVKEMESMKQTKKSTEDYLETNIDSVLELLEREKFIEKSDSHLYALTSLGFLASNIREVHCLVFAKLIESGDLDSMDVKHLIGLMSCFTNVVVQEEKRVLLPLYQSENLKNVLGKVASLYDYYEEYESKKRLVTGVNYDIHYDLIDAVIKWSNSESVEDCKRVLQKLEEEKEIFLGDFVKAILKINNISAEMEKVAESIGNMNFLEKLKEIPLLTQKYVVISQSLYV